MSADRLAEIKRRRPFVLDCDCADCEDTRWLVAEHERLTAERDAVLVLIDEWNDDPDIETMELVAAIQARCGRG